MLHERAQMFAKVRSFFAQREVLEVDVPILSEGASVDVHIDLIEAKCHGKRLFLHSSPEYGMKRLLASGSGDIYQMSHVFRDHEKGHLHTAEFMMVEWYRLGFSFEEMIQETVEFIHLFFPNQLQEIEVFSYEEVFKRFGGRYPENPEERDALFAFKIEPCLGKHGLSIVRDFPASQAALSQIGENGLAERFEIFYKGVELANGYHELADPDEQRARFESANKLRIELGKEAYPLDEPFLHALRQGIPDCCGVAVGFDRLLMLKEELREIRDASRFFI